jgi:hypothetical protein
MWWMIGGATLLAPIVVGAVWFLAPTLRTFRGPEFEPTAKDEASIERAQMSGPDSGTGAGG